MLVKWFEVNAQGRIAQSSYESVIDGIWDKSDWVMPDLSTKQAKCKEDSIFYY